MYNDATTVAVSCVFVGNSATQGGGIFSSDVILVENSIIGGNSATTDGGGLYCDFGGECYLFNNTIHVNSAGISGGGVNYRNDSGGVTFSNSIFWANTDSGGMDESAQIDDIGSLALSYCILQGGWTGLGSNNLSSNPLFFDPNGVDNVLGTVDDNLRLRPTSPGINSGNNAAVLADGVDLDEDGDFGELLPHDLAGGPRLLGTVDRGAYEYFPDCNHNGVIDSTDIALNTSEDCTPLGGSPNGIPDECDIAACPLMDNDCHDCNLNGVPDACDIGDLTSQDSNFNGIPDECGIFTGDCTVPDEEEFWTCPANWLLAGLYPDDLDSAQDICVSLPDGSVVVLDESVVIPSLHVQKGAELKLITDETVLDVDRAIQVNGTVAMKSCRLASNTPPTLTIGAGGQFRTAPCDSPGAASTAVSQEVQIQGDDCSAEPCDDGGQVILEESIIFESMGDLVIDGTLANGSIDFDHSLRADGASAPSQQRARSFHTPPVLIARDSSTVYVQADLSVLGAGALFVASSQPVTVGGDFENYSVRPDCIEWGSGSLVMGGGALRESGGAAQVSSGAPQVFEVAATDVGPVDSLADPLVEFEMGAVTIAAGADVTFADAFDNNLSGQAPCSEALYVGALTVEPGAAITVVNARIYYGALTADPGAITTIGCGELVEINLAPAPPAPAGDPTKNRYVSFVVPESGAGSDTAVRVELTSLHHPAGPPNAPNFTAFEGQYRYLNAIRDAGNNPVYLCPDSAALGSSYNCAKLGCTPEYRDWAGIFGGDVVHVTGDSVVPRSQYAVAQLASSCAGNEAACAAASAELTVSTERWGNVDNTPAGGTPNAIDIGFIVSKVKDAPGSFIESRCQLQGPTPNPYGLAVNALDIGRGVDAVKGLPYPFTISACP
jgi:predicted outer membrane repeat protein